MQFRALQVARNETGRFVFYGQPELRQPVGAARPAPVLAGEGFDMVFIGKPRNIIVGLRLEVYTVDAALRETGEKRQATAMQQRMNKGCNEYCLAGS